MMQEAARIDVSVHEWEVAADEAEAAHDFDHPSLFR
jgi:uncharacterized Zn-finger protein